MYTYTMALVFGCKHVSGFRLLQRASACRTLPASMVPASHHSQTMALVATQPPTDVGRYPLLLGLGHYAYLLPSSSEQKKITKMKYKTN